MQRLQKYFVGNSFILLFVLVSCLGRNSSVFAQEYLFDKGSNNNFTDAQEIFEPAALKNLYGYLSSGEDTTDYYVLEIADYTPQMQIELLVLDTEKNKNFQPSLIFTDPLSERMYGDVPFGFPLNLGGRVYSWNSNPQKKVADDIVLENLLRGPAILRDLSANRYYIAVFDPEGLGGTYVLHVGSVKKKESLLHKFNSFFALLRIKFSLF